MNAVINKDGFAPFVHLRTHSAYSLAEGAIKIPELVKLCTEYRMPAVALTDTRNLFGALEFSVACADYGVQPIVGCQLSVRREDEEVRGGNSLRIPEPDQLVLLCQDEEGYGNLLQLVSQAFLETPAGETPQVSMAAVEAHASGLIALSGGTCGVVGRHLSEDQFLKAEEVLLRLARIFDRRFYIEIQRHGLVVESRIESSLIDLAYAHDIPLVATNEPAFSTADMFSAHDALLCIAEKSYISIADRRRLTPEHRFKSAEEMLVLFRDLPEAIDNTLVIAQRCSVMVERRDPILPRSPTVGNRTEEEALRELSKTGLEGRLLKLIFTEEMGGAAREEIAKPYRDRLEYELGVIANMGFPGYFLIVADFIQWAKDQGIPVGPGRGSGAGSVVAWALRITDLDPLRFDLLFERFLNPERVSMPDFDIDFCQDRREEVIKYVQKEYGADRVAQIITFGKLQARAALRNVGRVLEMPLGYVDKICKMIPNNPASPVTLQEAIDSESELKKLRDTDENVAQLFDISLKLEGLYNHASTHAAGVVIGDRPLAELVALYRDPHSEMPVTQFNMKWVEQAGLVKFDFLGLKTLTVLDQAVKLLENRQIEIDLATVPLDDQATFDMLSRGDTTGVFQLESTGMRDVLRKLKPDVFEDIIAVVALYRPGPMDNIPSFIERKNGREDIAYMHPVLEPILKETYGIMIYQEQVMQAAQEMAGYSLGSADLLRRAMGKKIQAEMDAQREQFVRGATELDTTADKASEVFDTIAKFAGYGFNKSHAAAYALVAYQTGYLKANYPVEFMAATMTLDMQNTEKLDGFKSELKRLGIDLLPPSVNHSGVGFIVEQKTDESWAVRYALAAIKNVGAGAIEGMVAARVDGGPFKDIVDFAGRLDTKLINKRMIENLVRAGALDALHGNRAEMMAGAESILRHVQAGAEARNSNQHALFGAEADRPDLKLPQRDDWRQMERLDKEREAFGFFLSAHPLDAYAATLHSQGVITANHLDGMTADECRAPVRMAGIMGSKRERISKSGNKYAFIQLSDATGSYEAVVFSEVLVKSRALMESGEPMLITLEARLEDEQVRLMVSKMMPLDEAVAARLDNLRIELKDGTPVDEIKEIIDANGKGNGRILLVARSNEHVVEVALAGRYAISPQTLGSVKDVPGVTDIRQF
ncbi:MAG: DNA polymerase III subunit alpha [Rhodospirillaceae bacterium]|nr:DNA polymerase III subunit alpha [Rhodospirillaceae bacterium]